MRVLAAVRRAPIPKTYLNLVEEIARLRNGLQRLADTDQKVKVEYGGVVVVQRRSS